MSEQTLSTKPLPMARPINQPVVLYGPWLLIARLVWMVLAVLTLAILVILISRGPYLLLVENDISLAYATVQGLVSYQTFARIILMTRYITLATYLLTALFIFWRKSNEVIGLITSLMLMTLPLLFNLGGAIPTISRGGLDNLLIGSWSLTLVGVLAMLIFLNVFPTGRFPSRLMGRLFWLGAALLILAAVSAVILDDDSWSYSAVIAGTAVSGWILISVVGQVYRYLRVSGPVERLQTRLVFASLALIIVWALTIWNASPFRLYSLWAGIWGVFRIFGTILVLSLLPLSIARAIMRYHLWDIDIIVRKTLVYALLTGFLLLVYFTSIVTLQSLFSRLTGQDSTLATILSTLLIAALFLPVRRRIQRIIDRRFYRRKYDAQKTLEQFAHTARDETDLEKLTAELVRVIQETMEPEFVSIWLKPTADGRPPTTDG